MGIVGLFARLTVTGDLLVWKVIASTVVFCLAGIEVLLAARLWGAGELPPIKRPVAAKLHRAVGRVALILAVAVAFVCIAGPGAPVRPPRVLLHSIFGTLLFALLAAKFTLLSVARKGRKFLPYIGTGLFFVFGGIWVTSVVDFVAAR